VEFLHHFPTLATIASLRFAPTSLKADWARSVNKAAQLAGIYAQCSIDLPAELDSSAITMFLCCSRNTQN
jgi:hypothetical protein